MSLEVPGAPFCRAWTAAKAGNSAEQNEDAFAIRRAGGTAGPALTIALADGATEAVYSGAWARSLVSLAEPQWPALPDDELDAKLDAARREFRPVDAGSPAPWYVRNKYLEQGSQATLMVVALSGNAGSGTLELRALAVGDCLLLLFRASGEIETFPVGASAEFGVNPVLVSSRSAGRVPCERWSTCIGPGEILLFCTDAVGKWALECLETNRVELLTAALLGLIAAEPEAREPDPAPAAAPGDSTDAPETPHAATPPTGGAAPHAPRERLLLWALRLCGLRASARKAPEPDAPDPGPEQAPDPAPPSAQDFTTFVERCRAGGPDDQPRMRNDDCTLLLCVPALPGGPGADADAIRTLRERQKLLSRGARLVRAGDRPAASAAPQAAC